MDIHFNGNKTIAIISLQLRRFRFPLGQYFSYSVARRGFTDAKLPKKNTENSIFILNFKLLNNRFPRTCYIYFDSSHRDESKYTTVIIKFGEGELVKSSRIFFLIYIFKYFPAL